MSEVRAMEKLRNAQGEIYATRDRKLMEKVKVMMRRENKCIREVKGMSHTMEN
jgi:hypothetical protein